MAEFWEALYNPVPFYTVDNVPDTITYIENHPAPAHNEYMLAALRWVLTVLNGDETITLTDWRLLTAAADTAKEEHDKGVFKRDFIAVVRWRYAMTALGDYINNLKARGCLT